MNDTASSNSESIIINHDREKIEGDWIAYYFMKEKKYDSKKTKYILQRALKTCSLNEGDLNDLWSHMPREV